MSIHIDNLLANALRRVAEGIDPNWLCLTIQLSNINASLRYGELDVDYLRTEASLNGPRHGDVDLLSSTELRSLGVGRLLARLCALVVHGVSCVAAVGPQGRDFRRAHRFTFYNERHCVELIPGRTEISYETCQTGIVYSASTYDFTLWFDGERAFNGSSHFCDHSRAELVADLAIDRINDPDHNEPEHPLFGDIHYLREPVHAPRPEEVSRSW